MKTRSFFAGLVALTALSAFTAREARADFCVIGAGGVKYQLQWGTANAGSGSPRVVTGVRVIGPFRAPVFGTLLVSGTTAVIGLTEAFDFGSGVWTHPTATTVFTFPPAGGGGPRYDTTYHGNGAPHNVMGGLTGTSCPVADASSTAPQAVDNPDANLGPAHDANP
jgi:hypothetical protein